MKAKISELLPLTEQLPPLTELIQIPSADDKAGGICIYSHSYVMLLADQTPTESGKLTGSAIRRQRQLLAKGQV